MIEVLNTCSCAFIVKAGHVIQLLFLIFWRTDTQDIRNSGIRHLQPQIQPLGFAVTFKLIAPQISKKTKQTQTPRNRHVRNVSAVIRNSRILNILTYLTNNKKWNLKIFFYLIHPMSFTSHWLHGTLFSVILTTGHTEGSQSWHTTISANPLENVTTPCWKWGRGEERTAPSIGPYTQKQDTKGRQFWQMQVKL